MTDGPFLDRDGNRRPNRKQRRANMQRDPRDLSGARDLSPPQMGRVTAPPALFLRDVNEEGWCPAPVVNGQGILARSQYLGADELINEIIGGCRQMVREELAAFLAGMMGDREPETPEATDDEWNGPITTRVHLAGCTGNANCVEFPGCRCDVAEEAGPPEPVKVRIPRTGPREA